MGRARDVARKAAKRAEPGQEAPDVLTLKAEKRAAVAARLEQITKDGGGVLKLDSVIADARQPDSPLHDLYKWDVEEAAMEYWRDRTRTIVRTVHYNITFEDRVLAVPYYVHNPQAENREDGYVPITSVRKAGSEARDILAAELSRAASALNRAQTVAVALGLADEVSSVLDRLGALRAQLAA